MLQTAKFFSTIEDALATKADQAVKIHTLGGLADLCRIVGRACEPFIIPLLTPVLLAAGDKVRRLIAVSAAGCSTDAILCLLSIQHCAGYSMCGTALIFEARQLCRLLKYVLQPTPPVLPSWPLCLSPL